MLSVEETNQYQRHLSLPSFGIAAQEKLKCSSVLVIGAGGLGVPIWRGITTYYREMIVAGSLLIAGLAISVDLLIGLLEKKMRLKLLGTNTKGEFKYE